ncbi:MAG: hypothetical protein JSW73_03245 [Candidatus Woesearchaeota archaeon]|nr:MAG: hypothetical protein JSW73_03245 [Candidatus Woesearchaeota archaeon]
MVEIKETSINDNLTEVKIEAEVRRAHKGIKRILLENIFRECIFKVEGIDFTYFSVKPIKFKSGGLLTKHKLLDPGMRAEEIGRYILANHYDGPFKFISKNEYRFKPDEGKEHPTLDGKLTIYGFIVKGVE